MNKPSNVTLYHRQSTEVIVEVHNEIGEIRKSTKVVEEFRELQETRNSPALTKLKQCITWVFMLLT